ncbi:DUF6777 domain-containing protein [Streptomyces uncialis]|uniref:DUF6777 domain-containing protein n=1 Tax=Streptomyces uncialis TaxID=1048205 RepID=UPI003801B403
MSAEPPPPGRPTGPSPSAAPTGPPSGPPAGPPSGPLSDPSRPGSPSGPARPPADQPPGPPYGHPDDGAHGTTGTPTPPPDHHGTRPGTGGGGTAGGGGTGPGGGKGGGEGGGRGGDGPGPGGAPPPESDGGGGTPWWRSAPRVALLTLGVVAAVVLGVMLTRSDGSGSGDGPSGGGGGEVFLQAADSTGRDPFTESTARDSSPPPNTPSLPGRSESAPAAQGVSGAAPGLYGGTRKAASCDVEKQIRFLGAEEAKNKAFASALGIAPDKVPGHLRALTPVQLRLDTRVTNHGYANGSATAYQAVLEAGTAVLVDDRGLPTVRCACGNPLTEPVALRGTPKVVGDAWPGYRASNVVVVKPASRPVDTFVIYDPQSGEWFTRDPGGTGSGDRQTTPPTDPTPSPDGSPSGDTSTGSTDEPGTPSDGTGGPSTGSPPAEQPGSPSAGSPPPATEEPPLSSGPGDTQAPPSGPA